MEFLIIFILAYIPALVYVITIYWLDRYEKEPKFLIGMVFIWGAVVAAGVAYIINTIFGVSIYLITSSEIYSEIATGTLSAPLVEESLKGMAVLILFIFYKKEFDSILDGIVYAAVVALGFAATENILYMYEMGYLVEGWAGVQEIFVLRVVMGAWNHATYTAFIGIGLAISRLTNASFTSWFAPMAGWAIAVFVHFFHNLIASFASGIWGLVTLFGTDWIGWLFMFGLIFWANKQEKKLLQIELKEEVEAGLISVSQYKSTTSFIDKGEIILKSIFSGNFKVNRRFYHLCAELAHKKSQYKKLGDVVGNLKESIKELKLHIEIIQAKIILESR